LFVGGADKKVVPTVVERVRTFGLFRCSKARGWDGRKRKGCGQEIEADNGKCYCGYPGSHCQFKYEVKSSEGDILIWDENRYEEEWGKIYEWVEICQR
jgi:hypothetical protein